MIYAGALEFLNGKQRKVLATNSVVVISLNNQTGNTEINVWYYQTLIIKIYHTGEFVVDTKGWNTVSTMKRIRTALEKFGVRSLIRPYLTNKFPHIVDGRGSKIAYFDGMKFDVNGLCVNYWNRRK